MANETSSLLRGSLVLGLSLIVGLVGGAGVLGYNARVAASARQSITVKGLAEKPVKADLGVLHMTLGGTGATGAEALAQLRAQRPALDAFIHQQGFSETQVQVGGENFAPVYRENENGQTTTVVDHYEANVTASLTSKDVNQIAKTTLATLALREKGLKLNVAAPEYLVSSLEDVKMSLIGAATENATTRAGEFARHGKVKVGAMKNASQGAFYILPESGSQNSDGDYGGIYDKSTINKIARVVVTIEYAIQP